MAPRVLVLFGPLHKLHQVLLFVGVLQHLVLAGRPSPGSPDA